MTFTHIQEEDRNGIGVLRLARPPANAIDLSLALELAAAAASLATSGLRAAVLTGSGPCFSGGVDLKVIPGYGPEQQREMIRAINRLVAGFYACPIPLVAAINGHAIGGGLIIPLCADYRVCTTAPCKLGVTEARVGIPFPAGPLAVLRAELAPPAVRVMTLRSLALDPQAALAMGVVDELCAPERVLDRALEMAAELAALPRDAYGRIKHQLRAKAIEETRAAAEEDHDPMLDAWLGAGTTAAAAAALRERFPRA